jgi:Asp-tRNA(Asn)/Glu-tRNA(Gln) amidotransferase C subunit
MPFAPQFNLVYDVIKEALKNIMMGGVYRADDLETSPAILERILDGISSAKLVIADLTGRNPNVFYELGIAHLFTKNVLLLTQDINDVPFDLRGLSCGIYSTNSKEDLDNLAKLVREKAKKSSEKKLPTLIDDKIERTKRIVNYMKELNQLPTEKIENMTIRHEAGLSSLSNIPYGSSDGESDEYSNLLVQEKELLIGLSKKVKELKVIISPLATFDRSGINIPRIKKRLDALKQFLESKDAKKLSLLYQNMWHKTFYYLVMIFYLKDIDQDLQKVLI